MEQRLSLVADYNNKTLSWGSYTATTPHFIHKRSKIPWGVFGGYRPSKPKDMAAILKMSPSTFMKVWNAVMFKMWVVPVLPYANDLCKAYPYNKAYCYDINALQRLHNILPLIEQTYKDGNRHIAPIIFKTMKSPQELKATLGKGLWKSLCANTFTRNKLISHRISHAKPDYNLQGYNNIPSTLLAYVSLFGNDELIWAKDNVKPWKNIPLIREACDTYKDTKRMAARLNLPFNPKWSYQRMEEVHGEYTAKINRQSYSSDVFPSLAFENIREYVYGEYKASLLLSPKDIVDEGIAMHHCVAWYAVSVRDGIYLVYSVSKGGKKVSTIGINKTDNKYRLDQHYGECNKQVSEEEKTLAIHLIQALNNKAS